MSPFSSKEANVADGYDPRQMAAKIRTLNASQSQSASPQAEEKEGHPGALLAGAVLFLAALLGVLYFFVSSGG